MALLEDLLGGWGGFLVGVGATIAFPSIGPVVGSIVRPAAKALIKGVLLVSDQVSDLAGSAAGGIRQLVGEAPVDSRGKGAPTPAPAAKAVRP
jgi:hypothetical protein